MSGCQCRSPNADAMSGCRRQVRMPTPCPDADAVSGCRRHVRMPTPCPNAEAMSERRCPNAGCRLHVRAGSPSPSDAMPDVRMPTPCPGGVALPLGRHARRPDADAMSECRMPDADADAVSGRGHPPPWTPCLDARAQSPRPDPPSMRGDDANGWPSAALRVRSVGGCFWGGGDATPQKPSAAAISYE